MEGGREDKANYKTPAEKLARECSGTFLRCGLVFFEVHVLH